MKTSTQTKSIGSNIKSIIKTSINIPLELLSVTVEVTNDAAQLTSSAIRGAVPTTKAVMGATKDFGVGLCNPNATDEELDERCDDLSLEDMFKDMAKGSRKFGKSLSKSTIDFFNDEQVQK